MLLKFRKCKNKYRVFDGWMEKDNFVVDIISDSETLFDVKIIGSTSSNREAFEMLRTISRMDLVNFKIQENAGKLFFGFEAGKTDFWLGKVPVELSVLIMSSKKFVSLFENANIDSYALGMSLVGFEIDRARLMEAAEDGYLDEMPEEDFLKLLGSMYEILDSEVYVTKVRFRMTLLGENPVLDCRQPMKIKGGCNV